jgi:hypothetical protein
MVNALAVVVFDDERAVANAGVMLPAVLAGRLGIEALGDECVDLGNGSGRPSVMVPDATAKPTDPEPSIRGGPGGGACWNAARRSMRRGG